MGNNHLGYVFPGYRDYQALGVVSGADLAPNYHPMLNGIFFDDFEGGNEDAWSGSRG
jgi:hypothetical protein